MMLSAAAVGPALASAGEVPVGETILGAVRETRRWVETNTNLGIVLLFAPVARAAALAGRGASGGPNDGSAADGPDDGSGSGGRSLGEALEDVLASTTVRDAELAYEAIRTARPGGLGRVDEQDVSGRPTVPLREAMGLAADRDSVAAQYATGYRRVRSVGVPVVRSAREDGLGWAEAAHRCFGRLLAEGPDSLIARKFGREEAESIRAEAARLLEDGPPGSNATEAGWEELNRRLRSASPPRNPGTTADLTAAALFLALLGEAGWNYPGNGQ
jgi:triphosphoribosyl-dephospho-CoA synthase